MRLLPHACASRSFSQQDVLVPWHLGDQHAQEQHMHEAGHLEDGEMGGNLGGKGMSDEDMAAREASQVPGGHADRELLVHDSSTDSPARPGLGSELASQAIVMATQDHPRCRGEVESALPPPPPLKHGGSPVSDQGPPNETAWARKEGSSAPAPRAARHGVRLDGVAGARGSVVYQRYCHVYAEGELEALVRRVEGLRVLDSFYDKSNWCVLAERC